MLSTLVEVVTISAYPADGSPSIQLTARGNNVTLNSSNANLASGTMVRLDFRFSWTTLRGRTRAREISTIVTKGGNAL